MEMNHFPGNSREPIAYTQNIDPSKRAKSEFRLNQSVYSNDNFYGENNLAENDSHNYKTNIETNHISLTESHNTANSRPELLREIVRVNNNEHKEISPTCTNDANKISWAHRNGNLNKSDVQVNHIDETSDARQSPNHNKTDVITKHQMPIRIQEELEQKFPRSNLKRINDNFSTTSESKVTLI